MTKKENLIKFDIYKKFTNKIFCDQFAHLIINYEKSNLYFVKAILLNSKSDFQFIYCPNNYESTNDSDDRLLRYNVKIIPVIKDDILHQLSYARKNNIECIYAKEIDAEIDIESLKNISKKHGIKVFFDSDQILE